MAYTIEYDGLKFPVNSLDVNRTPPFTFFWGVRTKDLVGVIHDPVKDFFQITFSTYNIKPLTEKILGNFCGGRQCSIITPYASFNDAVIHSATIDNDTIEVSLIASEPSLGSTNLRHNICLALEANYYNTLPNFVNLFQFGNYLAISTFPFNINRNISKGTRFFSNEHWSIFQMPVSHKPNVYKFNIENMVGYCFTSLPELLTDVIIQPAQGNLFSYMFGISPSCELSAYLKVEDLTTGEIWFKSGNHGTIELAPGIFRITPIVAIPEFNPTYITGTSSTVLVPPNQKILCFLSPLTLSQDEPLRLYAYEDLLLQFEGWKTIPIQANTITEIKFDYTGNFQCNVISTDRNVQITSFVVNVYGTTTSELEDVDYVIKVDNNILSKYTTITSNLNSYLAISNLGKVLGYNKGFQIIADSNLLTGNSQIITLDNNKHYTIYDSNCKLLDSAIDDYFVQSVDVYFHSLPVVNKPTYMHVDGLVHNIWIEDADIIQISNTLYKVTFRSDGLKKIILSLSNDKTLTKYVTVEPGFKKIIQVQEDGLATCSTGDYWAVIQSPTVTNVVPPNSSFTWTEYGFGLTSINVLLSKGATISNIQYQFTIYNKDALKIVAYDRTLQLLAVPHAEIDHVMWYLNDMFIGMGTSITVPPYISGGTYTVKAIVYSNMKQIVLTEVVRISNNNVNKIQLSCQPIHPHISPESTNRLVTIYNGSPSVTFRYLHSSLNISLTKYLYLEKYTYVGNAKDLRW